MLLYLLFLSWFWHRPHVTRHVTGVFLFIQFFPISPVLKLHYWITPTSIYLQLRYISKNITCMMYILYVQVFSNMKKTRNEIFIGRKVEIRITFVNDVNWIRGRYSCKILLRSFKNFRAEWKLENDLYLISRRTYVNDSMRREGRGLYVCSEPLNTYPFGTGASTLYLFSSQHLNDIKWAEVIE